MLNTILLPFVKLIETFFLLNVTILGNYGLSLILLSLEISLISFPLFLLAEKWKVENEYLQIKMSPAIDSIKDVYTGQKRYYLIKEVHRINSYTFVHNLKVSFGLLIQIPLFFAVYKYLSHFDGYRGISFLLIKDLSLPDGLLSGINLMPFLMTMINLLGSWHYAKGRKPSEKIQLVVMAVLFLILLYNRPSSLLIYWTMNNLLAIPKNLLLKSFYPPPVVEPKETSFSLTRVYPEIKKYLLPVFMIGLWIVQAVFVDKWIRVSRIMILLTTVFAGISSLIMLKRIVLDKYRKTSYKWSLSFSVILWILFGVLLVDWLLGGSIETNFPTEPKRLILFLLADLIIYIGIKYAYRSQQTINCQSGIKTFILPLALVTYFILLYVPLQIYSSAASDLGITLGHILFIQGGIWIAVILSISLLHRILPGTFKVSVNHITLFLLFTVLTYYFIFRTDYGILDGNILSGAVKLKQTPFSRFLLDFTLLAFFFWGADKLKNDKKMKVGIFIIFIFVGLIGQNIHSLIRANTIYEMAGEKSENSYLPPDSEKAHLFSRNGVNTLLIVSDMFTGGYMQPLLDDNPEWKEELSGFIWYPDTLSVSRSTFTSTPGILGGWIYAPRGMNEIKGKNRDKLSLSYQPFFEKVREEGAQLSLLNPKIDYEEGSRPSIVYNEDYTGYWNSLHEDVYFPSSMNKRTLMTMVGVFYASPFCMRKSVYSEGFWSLFPKTNIIDSIYRRVKKEWAYLDLLPLLSQVTDDESPQVKYMHNLLTHFPYGIDQDGDIITQEKNGLSEIGTFGTEAAMYSDREFIEKMIDWFDWMREQDIYDNTQIIIVSDHGQPAGGHDPMMPQGFSDRFEDYVFDSAHALLLYKPLNASGEIKVEHDQMSNADCISLLAPALNLFIEDDRPEERYYAVSLTEDREFPHVEETVYDIYNVKGSMFDIDNWEQAE